MSQKHSLSLEHKIYPDLDLVYSTLLDLRKFGHIHELMKQVVLTDESSPEFKTYFVTEEAIVLGFIKTKPQYYANVYEIEVGKHIRYTSHVKKQVELQIDFYFNTQNKNQLIVREDIQIEANYIIGKIFLNLLKKAHLNFFENLKTIFKNNVEDLT